MNSYRVVLAGKLSKGIDAETAITQFMKLTNTDCTVAENLLTSGNPTVIKENIDKETGENYINALSNIGVVAELIDEPEFEAVLPIDNFGGEPPAYTPPAVNLLSKPILEPLPVEFRVVPARNAIQWLRSAFKMFFEEPWRWPLIFIIGMAIYAVISFVPFLGYLIGPIFLGAIMTAASTQKDGLKVGNLFLVFQRKWPELILLAIFQIVTVLIVGILMLIPLRIIILPQLLHSIGSRNGPVDPLGILLANPTAGISLLIMNIIFIILWLIAFYFAPVIITLRNRRAWESICINFKAILKNWKPFLIAGIIISFFFIIIIAIFTVCTFKSITLNDLSHLFWLIAALIYLILIIPLFIVLNLFKYTSFEDIFHIEQKEEI
jgi:hypothetical protein